MTEINEPTENAGTTAALDNLKTAMQEFKDVMREAEDAGLTPLITEMNLDRMNRIKSGILEPEPEPDDDDTADIDQVEDAARALIAGTGENPEPDAMMPVDAADSFIKGLASIMSAGECRTAERENPQPEITETDPLKARIIGLLTENTGCDICDSGGAYGRQWQQNRNVSMDVWDSRDACTIEVYDDDEVIVNYDIYHYLNNFLSITDESERLNGIMGAIVNASDEGSYMADMEAFLELKGIEIEGYALHNITNTYNHDNILSQVLQYAIFEVDGDDFILLQVHGGADVRGGYTKPQVFAIEEPDYFVLASVDVNASCDCSDWYSDDAGCHYYKDGSSNSPKTDWEHDRDANTITCNKCGKPVTFSVTESV